MSEALLVLPHQLFRTPPVAAAKRAVLVEEQLFFCQYAFHRRKLQFQRGALQAYRDLLEKEGWQVQYIEAHEVQADIRLLPAALQRHGISTLHVVDPCDDWLSRRLRRAAESAGLQLRIHENPQFLLSPPVLDAHFDARRKRYRHQQFYQAQRLHHGLLLDAEARPQGGVWSFDKENRQRFPRRSKVPPLPPRLSNTYREAAKNYVRERFPDNPGATDSVLEWPLTHAEAEAWLDDFLYQRFAGFGTYEDAIVAREPVLHHSLLSPLLNTGLLLPGLVIERALAHAQDCQVPLNDVEGFLRQILGWREFIRGIYLYHGRAQRTANHWGFQRPLPIAFYSADTGIDPVDTVIRRVLQHGYCHHIERLMVLGCFMLLCECHPDGVYRWFMELFVDAFDWVMVPNVYGMSQYADGGLLASKPYICGSNYILKMSDFPKGDWCETWDALFWRFLSLHADRLRGNPRLNMLLGGFFHRPAAECSRLLAHAEHYLENLHRTPG